MRLVICYGQPVVMARHPIADISAAGVYHQPDVAIISHLEFDEMIPSAEGAELQSTIIIFPGYHRQLFVCIFFNNAGIVLSDCAFL